MSSFDNWKLSTPPRYDVRDLTDAELESVEDARLERRLAFDSAVPVTKCPYASHGDELESAMAEAWRSGWYAAETAEDERQAEFAEIGDTQIIPVAVMQRIAEGALKAVAA